MTTATYRFGDFTLTASTRELKRGDTPVAVSPRAFDCLAYLIEHRDRAVGKDELVAAIWERVDVSDTQLGQTVLRARRAVNDDGQAQTVIRTVSRFGYRWVADVAIESRAPVAAASAPAVDTAKFDAPIVRPQPAETLADDLRAESTRMPPERSEPKRRSRPLIATLVAIITLASIAAI